MSSPFETVAFLIADYAGAACSAYLDTNAWSALAKAPHLASPLGVWLRGNALYPILSRFQMVELSAKPSLFEGLADAVEVLRPIMIDRGQHEFSGEQYSAVRRDLVMRLNLETPSLRKAFIGELLSSSSLQDARKRLADDSDSFGP